MTAVSFLVTDSTGRILRTGHVSNPDDVAGQAGVGELVFEGNASDVFDYYDIEAGETKPRTSNPTAISTLSFTADLFDSVILTNVPANSSVRVRGQSYLVDDGEFEYSTNVPGKFEIVVSSFPELDKVFKVEAV